MPKITNLTDDALIAIDNLGDFAGNLFSPTLRFGVTGLSRAGKTVFITSLVHNLIHRGKLPLFEAQSSGRISSAILQPQPSMDIPRFAYEEHVDTLINDRDWPNSTRAISELRLSLKYESASAWGGMFGPGTLNIDIVDYPGEWLLDLPLLALTYEQWSQQTLEASRKLPRADLAKAWHKWLDKCDPSASADEPQALELAALFTDYLRQCRQDKSALSALPPGRFLMPGDLEGSPVLTFSPLPRGEDQPDKHSLYALMQERFEAYKSIVVKPFFREHFARLDRQIVLVDALQAINASPKALDDLEKALADILSCFNPGSSSWLTSILGRRIDKILFAATKADHLHHENHDRLEKLLQVLVKGAVEKAKFSGASVEVLAIAAIRATKEGYAGEGEDRLPVVIGTPKQGEAIDKQIFDGETDTAIFPGDLPKDPAILFDRSQKSQEQERPELNFMRFRPPDMTSSTNRTEISLPHIRLDRALEFLFGDQLA